MKKFSITVVGIIALFVGLILSVIIKQAGELKSIDKTPVDISEVPDGVYEGYSETTLVKVRVRVTVADGRIENIEILEHECGRGKPAESIVANMKTGNTVEVDAVSGATVSSEVIKAAVRNALKSPE
ncbi:MAG: FMN-binding protein [Lachnospiraceae bacterium]|nr:FMN-binding protein [Lachnospiraceae bacterium]